MSGDLPTSIATHIERSRVYRALAQIFATPDAARFRALQTRDLSELGSALSHLGVGSEIETCAAQLAETLRALRFEDFEALHYAAFDVSGKNHCPATETTHTSDTPGHGLTRNVELADIAGFYRAFGVDLGEQAERADCISAELEFLQLVSAKQAIALEAHQLHEDADAAEQAEICRDAARAFLADHLTRWAGRFASALARTGAAALFVSAAELVRDFANFDRALLESQ